MAKGARALAQDIVAFLGKGDYDSPTQAIYTHFQDKLGYTSHQIFAAIQKLMASAERIWGKNWMNKEMN